MTGKSNVSICIDCANSVGFCPWSAHFEPITGWKAEKIKRFDGKRLVDSYKVTECPMFELDDINERKYALKSIGLGMKDVNY